jgi:hypothetical protein
LFSGNNTVQEANNGYQTVQKWGAKYQSNQFEKEITIELTQLLMSSSVHMQDSDAEMGMQ